MRAAGLIRATAVLWLFTVGAAQMADGQAASSDDSLEEWIGQMIMVGFRGTELGAGHPFLEDLRGLHLGGVILFDYDVSTQSDVRNIVSAQQVRSLIQQLQSASRRPLLVAVDQEGGRVRRLKEKHGFPAAPSQEELGRTDREEATREAARRTGNLLADLGINTNFAPVLDLALNPLNPVIASLGRSYGREAERAASHARWTMEEFHRAGILSAVKHFPGHGSSREDSHLGLPDVTDLWEEEELEPFRRVIREGLPDMVMTAHLYNSAWDALHPSTLSKAVVTGMLRGELGFQGVVVSDDLQMGAVDQNYTLRERIRLAVEAGVDILLFANNLRYDPRIAEKAHRTLKELVDSGVLTPERIRESYDRIVALKLKFEVR